MAMRPDNRTPAQKQHARQFAVTPADYIDPNATQYDERIQYWESEAEKERLSRMSPAERAAEQFRQAKDKKLATQEKAALDKAYTAEMFQHPTVRKLLNLKAYYESDESVPGQFLDRLAHVIQQWTEPGASRKVAEDLANEVFATESKRRLEIELQLQTESEAWNKRAAALRNAKVALDDAPDTTVAEQPAPATYEKSIALKSETTIGKAYELWIALPAGPDRDAVDAAIARKSIAGVIEALVEKYEKPEATEAATSEGGEV